MGWPETAFSISIAGTRTLYGGRSLRKEAFTQGCTIQDHNVQMARQERKLKQIRSSEIPTKGPLRVRIILAQVRSGESQSERTSLADRRDTAADSRDSS